jgi:predicted nucleic acid-binding protein
MADRLYLDANVLISVVEAPGRLTPAQKAMVDGIEAGRIAAVSSDLALAECLVQPMAKADDVRSAAFIALFESGAFEIAALDRPVLVEAARQRALARMNLPDAMHVALAVLADCAGFVTADQGVRLPPGLRRIAWDTLAEPGSAG